MLTESDYPKVYLYKRVVSAKLFIDENFDKPLDLNLVSNEAAFSKFHFIRLFKKIYGHTPHFYLRQVRLQHAKGFLEDGSSVVEACERSGFESVTSFTSLFKKEFGITPADHKEYTLALRHQMNHQPIRFVPHCFAQAAGMKKSNFEEVA